MGKNFVKFERRYFIKNLFNPKEVLNSFEWVHFESLKTFKKCVEEDLYYPLNILEITIKSPDEYKWIKTIFNETNICKNSYVILRTPYKEVAMNMIRNAYTSKRYFIFLDFDTPLYYNDEKTIKIIKINRNNYKEKINVLIDNYNKFGLLNYYLEFDYKSFDDMTIRELQDLQFWIFHLRAWRTPLPKQKGIINLPPPVLHNSDIFRKKIFVSNELKLYLNNKKEDCIFDLQQHLENNGETVPVKELDKLEKYRRLTEDMMVSEITPEHWGLLDFSQNDYVVEIPIICQLIGSWLYGSF